MITPKLVGRGLFVFSDPGGAKPILTLADEYSETLTAIIAVSDRVYPFFKDFSTKIDIPDLTSNIYDFKPDFVFTGTSYTSDFEIRYIKEAKKIGIPVYSFVDHWTNILKRFTNEKEIILPDIIFVLDDRAKEIAIQEGIVKEILQVLPNPYHTFLRKWTPNCTKEYFLKENKIQSTDLLITFAPDPLSNAGGIEKFGTDEIIIAKKFIKAILKVKSQKNITVIFKPHPNQNIEYVLPLFKHFGLNVICLIDVDTRLLLFYSDIIVGIFSNILIEAQILGKDVIRFLEKSNMDPLEQLNIGKICKSDYQFINSLQKSIKTYQIIN